MSYPALQLDVAWQLSSSQWGVNGNDTDYFLASPIKSSFTYSSNVFSFLWLYTEYHRLPYVVKDGGCLGWKEQVSWVTPPRELYIVQEHSFWTINKQGMNCFS